MELLNIDFDSGDPTVRQLFLVTSVKWPILLTVLYILTCRFVGPWYMKDKQPLELRIPMVIYDITLIIANAAVAVQTMYCFTQLSWEEMCHIGTVQGHSVAYKFVHAMHVFYLLKYVEFLDTMFFVLRKRNNLISNLHVFHHSITPFVVFGCMRHERNGIVAFPAVINSFVHVVMYTYYCLAALGPEYEKYLWWKRYVTQIQMVQFILDIFFVLVYVPMHGCRLSTFYRTLGCFELLALLVMFYDYYRNAYSRVKSEKES